MAGAVDPRSRPRPHLSHRRRRNFRQIRRGRAPHLSNFIWHVRPRRRLSPLDGRLRLHPHWPPAHRPARNFCGHANPNRPLLHKLSIHHPSPNPLRRLTRAPATTRHLRRLHTAKTFHSPSDRMSRNLKPRRKYPMSNNHQLARIFSTPRISRPANRAFLTIASTFLVLIAAPQITRAQQSPIRAEISFDQSLSNHPIDGRIFLVVSASKDNVEPRLQVVEVEARSQQVFGVDVDALAAGTSVNFDDSVLGYPARSFRDIPAGDYTVQGVLNIYTTFHRADGVTVKLPCRSRRRPALGYQARKFLQQAATRSHRSRVARRRDLNQAHGKYSADRSSQRYRMGEARPHSKPAPHKILGTADVPRRDRCSSRRLADSSQRALPASRRARPFSARLHFPNAASRRESARRPALARANSISIFPGLEHRQTSANDHAPHSARQSLL